MWVGGWVSVSVSVCMCVCGRGLARKTALKNSGALDCNETKEADAALAWHRVGFSPGIRHNLKVRLKTLGSNLEQEARAATRRLS